MPNNKLTSAINFIFRYIWAFLIFLITVEMFFTVYTAGILMQQSTNGMLQSVCGEVSGRVDGVLRLLNGLAQDKKLAMFPSRFLIGQSWLDLFKLAMDYI